MRPGPIPLPHSFGRKALFENLSRGRTKCFCSGDVKQHAEVRSNGVEVSFLALLTGFGSPDLFSTSCHGKTMVATGRPLDAGWESMVYLVAGAPIYREELERLQACV